MWIANAYMKSYVAKYIKKVGAMAISDLRKGMDESELMDDEFQIHFCLFTMGTLLCPSDSASVNSKLFQRNWIFSRYKMDKLGKV